MKSYDVNFHTQMSSSQSVVRCFSKKETSNQNRERWEKRYVQSKATEVGEFRAKIPPFLSFTRLQCPRYASSFADIQLEKTIK